MNRRFWVMYTTPAGGNTQRSTLVNAPNAAAAKQHVLKSRRESVVTNVHELKEKS